MAKAAANKAKLATKSVKKCVKKMAAKMENAAELAKKACKKAGNTDCKKRYLLQQHPKKVHKHIG